MVGSCAQQPEVDANADQALLSAVMEVALDPLSLQVDRVNSPQTRSAQLPLEGKSLEFEPDDDAETDSKKQDLEGRPELLG